MHSNKRLLMMAALLASSSAVEIDATEQDMLKIHADFEAIGSNQLVTDEDYRIAVFDGLLPPIAELERSGHTFMTWGRSIDQDSARAELARCYPVDFLV